MEGDDKMNVRVFGIESKSAKPFALIYGNSTETKPVKLYCGGSKFFETDTDKQYRYDDVDEAWYEILSESRRTDKAQNEWWGEKYSVPDTYVKSMDGALVTSYSVFMDTINSIMADPAAEPEDKFVPYTPSMCCLVKSIDLTSDDIVMDAYCYSNGKRVVVTKYADSYGQERYRVYEVDLTKPTPNKFVQNTLSDEWVIEHNLLKYPAVQVKDENDDLVFPADIEYIDLMTVKIKFSEPIKGYAILN